MTGRPETQTSTANAPLTKKLGLPTVPIFKVTPHTVPPAALGSQQAGPFTQRLPSRLPAQLPHSSPPRRPFHALAPMSECLIPVKLEKIIIHEKIGVIFCFCFVLFCLFFFLLLLLLLQATFALRSHGLELSGAQVR